jgi:hypothetical protein
MAANNLTDGTYWARIKTISRAESAPIELKDDQAIGANIGVIIQQISGLFYKVGNTTTEIDIEKIEANIISDKQLQLKTKFRKGGNSPFLGSVSTRILKNGKALATKFTSTSFYFDGIHSDIIDISDVPSGQYTAEVTFETKRSDISPSDLVQMQPVTATTTITIP